MSGEKRCTVIGAEPGGKAVAAHLALVGVAAQSLMRWTT